MRTPVGFEGYVVDDTPGAGSAYEIYADRMGSITSVVDTSTGSVVAEYSYDSFGQRTQHAGSLFQFYGFTGREIDSESGLIHLRLRAYDPVGGEFTQPDPIGFGAGTLNVYGYVGNNPFSYRDPTGLSQKALHGKFSAGVARMSATATSTVAIGALQGSALISGQLGGVAMLLSRNSGRIGRAAELAVKNTYFQDLRSLNFVINGVGRRADLGDKAKRLLIEVKNVQYQAYTRQLRDYMAYAKERGFDFHLFVRGPLSSTAPGTTRLSGKLQEAIDRADIILRHIP